MYLFLPIAGNAINVLIPLGLGALVGLLSGMFGVGGGFLMTPLLMMAPEPSTARPMRTMIAVTMTMSLRFSGTMRSFR